MSTWFTPLKRALSFDRLPWSGNQPNQNRYSINHPPYPYPHDNSALWLTTSLNPESYENNSLLTPSTATALLSHSGTFLLSPADVTGSNGNRPGSSGSSGNSGNSVSSGNSMRPGSPMSPSNLSTSPHNPTPQKPPSSPRKLRKPQPLTNGYKSQPNSPLSSNTFTSLIPRGGLQSKPESRPTTPKPNHLLPPLQLPQLYFQAAEEREEQVGAPRLLEVGGLEGSELEPRDQEQVQVQDRGEGKNKDGDKEEDKHQDQNGNQDKDQDQLAVKPKAENKTTGNRQRKNSDIGRILKWKEATPTPTTMATATTAAGITIRFSLDLNRPETYDDDAELFAFTMEELGGFYMACCEEKEVGVAGIRG
ncbi:hypothetical protein BZA77DRAFT_356699 [Pyronema omphalodes]|nr:hypothetical protein BZA77DRAFT_356699 [Pyronema omphalodes]